MHDTWATRDLPVLDYIASEVDEGRKRHQTDTVAAALGMPEDEAKRAFAALAEANPPYCTGITSAQSDGFLIITGVTERTRREVGAWPTPEGLADRLVTGLQEAAASEPDEAKRSRLREVATYLGGAARDVLVDVAGTAVVKSVGMG